jgi:hypothetical protein
MIKVFGPGYQYQGEILTQPAIIYLDDHHYDETNRCFQVERLLANSTCDPQQHILIIEGLGHDDVLSRYNCVTFPRFTAEVCDQFNAHAIQPDWSKKTFGFNFMINKPRLHRNFLLMLIAHFGLTNYTYSLPWKEKHLSGKRLMALTNNDHYRKIILDNTETMIPRTSYVFGPEDLLDQGLQNGRFTNQETYDKLLRTTVFEPSCISLITESLFFEQETRISEKTIMAMYGGTIPIWVGGWRHADRLSELGFDIFDDVVDHRYQIMPDPLDRCYSAIERNLGLLRDPNRVRKFVQDNQARFEHNLKLCRQNVFSGHLHNQIKKHDEHTQRELHLLLTNQKEWHVFDQLNPNISVSMGQVPQDMIKFKELENTG